MYLISLYFNNLDSSLYNGVAFQYSIFRHLDFLLQQSLSVDLIAVIIDFKYLDFRFGILISVCKEMDFTMGLVSTKYVKDIRISKFQNLRSTQWIGLWYIGVHASSTIDSIPMEPIIKTILVNSFKALIVLVSTPISKKYYKMVTDRILATIVDLSK